MGETSPDSDRAHSTSSFKSGVASWASRSDIFSVHEEGVERTREAQMATGRTLASQVWLCLIQLRTGQGGGANVVNACNVLGFKVTRRLAN